MRDTPMRETGNFQVLLQKQFDSMRHLEYSIDFKMNSSQCGIT